MWNWFENHQPQRLQISTLANFPFISAFIQSSNQMASGVDRSLNFFDRTAIYEATNFSAYKAALMTKNYLIFPAVFFKICRFHGSILLSL